MHTGIRCPSSSVREKGLAPGWTRYNEQEIQASLATFPVLGEETFSRLQKSGLRLPGCRYIVEAFEE